MSWACLSVYPMLVVSGSGTGELLDEVVRHFTKEVDKKEDNHTFDEYKQMVQRQIAPFTDVPIEIYFRKK